MRIVAATVVRAAEQASADVFHVAASEVRSRSRTLTASLARQASYLVVREITKYSLPEIARAFGRDHTTVLHGIRAFTKKAKRDQSLRDAVESIKGLTKKALLA